MKFPGTNFRLVFLLVGAWANCPAAPASEIGPGVLVSVGPVWNRSWGNYPGHVNHTREMRTCALDNGRTRYRFQYSCCTDPSHAPGVETPEGYIGMPGPAGANWYQNGFLRIVINSMDIGKTHPSTIREIEHGERGTFQIVWDREDAGVRATFLCLPKDPALYIQVTVFPKEKLDSLKLLMTAYPGAYTREGDRWVITPRQQIEQARKAKIVPSAEPWLLIQDRKFSPDTGKYPGGCGLLFLPDEVGEAEAQVTTYPVQIALSAKPGIQSLCLVVWDFFDRPNCQALEYTRVHAGEISRRLKGLDFSSRELWPSTWGKLKAEVKAALPFAKDNRKLTGQVTALMKKIDMFEQTNQRRASIGQAVDLAEEDAALDTIRQLRKQMWELRFARLFAE